MYIFAINAIIYLIESFQDMKNRLSQLERREEERMLELETAHLISEEDLRLKQIESNENASNVNNESQ